MSEKITAIPQGSKNNKKSSRDGQNVRFFFVAQVRIISGRLALKSKNDDSPGRVWVCILYIFSGHNELLSGVFILTTVLIRDKCKC